jgi:hypothetical protein
LRRYSSLIGEYRGCYTQVKRPGCKNPLPRIIISGTVLLFPLYAFLPPYLFSFCYEGIFHPDAPAVAFEASSKMDGEKQGKLIFIYQ